MVVGTGTAGGGDAAAAASGGPRSGLWGTACEWALRGCAACKAACGRMRTACRCCCCCRKSESGDGDGSCGGCGSRCSGYAALYGRLLREHWLPTLVYCCAYCSFGMCVGSLGAVLLDLTCLLSATVSEVSWAFFAQTFCTMLGSAVVGLLTKWLAADFLLLVSSIVLPVSILVLSFTDTLSVATALLAVIGICSGFVDCLANLQMIRLYDKSVSPFLQAMYFAYGLGALLSPLVAQPFLVNEDCTRFVDNGTAVPESFREESRVSNSFWIMSALQAPVALLLFALVARDGFRVRAVNPNFQRLVNTESVPSLMTKTPDDAKGKLKDFHAQEDQRREVWSKYVSNFKASFAITTWRNVVITASIACIVFLYDGLQGNFSEYIAPYSLKEVEDFTKSDGAFINMAFWASFTVGRLVAVVGAIKLTPYFMLVMNIAGCTFSLSLLVSISSRKASLYAGTVLFGLFCSSVTPTTICMAEQFMDVTALHMTLVVVTASAGEMLVPLIQGQIFEENPRSFLVTAVVSAAISWFNYIVFWLTGKDTEKHKSVIEDSFIFMNKKVKCDESSKLNGSGYGHKYTSDACEPGYGQSGSQYGADVPAQQLQLRAGRPSSLGRTAPSASGVDRGPYEETTLASKCEGVYRMERRDWTQGRCCTKDERSETQPRGTASDLK